MEFKAAILHTIGAPLTIETVKLAPLKSADVLVRIHASGLCHTDLEVMLGSLKYPLPIILGHEAAGVVEAVGPDVTLAKPGDHVVCSWNPSCGHCFYCDQGQPILCEVFARTQPRGLLLDGASRLSIGNEKLYHYSAVSSHAEYCVVHESSAIPVPPAIPFDRACLIGCGVMTGVGGATRIAKIALGANVAVFGVGAVGLNVIQGARMVHAGMIIAVDVNDRKLELARAFGATHTINAGREDAVDAIRALTKGRGADYTFEAAGNPQTLQQALEAARPGAQIVILGKTNVDAQVSLRFGSLMGEKLITRSSYGGARPRRDFPLLAQAYLDGDLKLDELISRRISLSEINDGFDQMKRGELLRAVITFNA